MVSCSRRVLLLVLARTDCRGKVKSRYNCDAMCLLFQPRVIEHANVIVHAFKACFSTCIVSSTSNPYAMDYSKQCTRIIPSSDQDCEFHECPFTLLGSVEALPLHARSLAHQTRLEM